MARPRRSMIAAPTGPSWSAMTSSHFSQPAEHLAHVARWPSRISSAFGMARPPWAGRSTVVRKPRAVASGLRLVPLGPAVAGAAVGRGEAAPGAGEAADPAVIGRQPDG